MEEGVPTALGVATNRDDKVGKKPCLRFSNSGAIAIASCHKIEMEISFSLCAVCLNNFVLIAQDWQPHFFVDCGLPFSAYRPARQHEVRTRQQAK